MKNCCLLKINYFCLSFKSTITLRIQLQLQLQLQFKFFTIIFSLLFR
jgi:hypothetical protein